MEDSSNYLGFYFLNTNLDDYELVEDRLKAFWKDNPNGCITTDVVHITDDGSCVTFKAYIHNDPLFISTNGLI